MDNNTRRAGNIEASVDYVPASTGQISRSLRHQALSRQTRHVPLGRAKAPSSAMNSRPSCPFLTQHDISFVEGAEGGIRFRFGSIAVLTAASRRFRFAANS
jgi:hypothetical protein